MARFPVVPRVDIVACTLALACVAGSADDAPHLLAFDEVVVRDLLAGHDRAVAVAPPADVETLRTRMAARGQFAQVFPVLYPRGAERTIGNRRLVTPGLRVRLDGTRAAADVVAVAERAGLRLGEIPSYAPGFVVLEAADSLAALEVVDEIRRQPGVAAAAVLLASQKQRRAMPDDTLVGQQWHLKYQGQSGVVGGTDINAEGAWDYPAATGIRGNNVRIGIVDDGLQTDHPDLTANVDTVNDHDWNDSTPDNPSPPAGQGTGQGDDHGTSCAGNAAARGNNGLGVCGSAPEARLVGLRLIAAAATDAQEAAALAWKKDLIEVKSNSWGPYDDAKTLEGPGPLAAAALLDAVQTGRGGKGTVFLWAGGNGGNAGDNSNYDGYANSPFTIAVAAFDSQSRQAYYSEPGANLVVTAPSSGLTSSSRGITTVDRTGADGYNNGSLADELADADYTQTFGGTSSATPTVAGVVALLLQANPNLGWRDVQEILIRSAKQVNPSDSGWANNPAGLHFNHKFGAGLVDASAAVAMATGWSNLGARASVSQSSTVTTAVPDNNAGGVVRSFDLTASNLRVEHVTVTLTVTNVPKGQLDITLTSPGGMVSQLCAPHADTGNRFSSWTFMTVRDWGENSAGVWTLKVADRKSGISGALSSASLEVFGTAAVPVNPAPVAQIIAPVNGAIFSPGSTVTVEANASDLTASGSSGTVAQVELLDNGTLVGTDTSAPWSFVIQPAPGSHALQARATDSEGASGSSASVVVIVADQAPVITAANIGTSPAYDDTPLAVAGLTASDPEGTALTFGYQWEQSDDGVNYTMANGETSAILAPAAGRAGFLWRCAIVANDGTNDSAPFVTAPVNLLTRPPATVATGSAFGYQSGLVLRGGGTPVSRQAILSEFSQGPSGGSSEWIEILTLRTGSLRSWRLSDAAGGMLVFNDSPAWDNIPSGTLIVVYNGGTAKDPLLPANDADPADGTLVLSSADATCFDAAFDTWPALGNSGDSIFLDDGEGDPVAALSFGSSTLATPHLATVGSAQAAYFRGDSDAGADDASQWAITSSTVLRDRHAPRAAGDLFISEYVEGSGNNKAIELFNPSTAAVDLSVLGYKLEIHYNGGSAAGATINLTGTVLAGGTFVIKHSNASSLIVAGQTNINLNFNGDDAVVLRKGTVAVDVFGQVGFDPGSAWTAGSVSTVNKTLRRKPGVTQGDTVANDAFDPSLQWDVFDVDTFDGLGSHIFTDDEPSLEGVTPGHGNSPANVAWIASLRSGSAGAAAMFRLGSGVVLPAGLGLDPATGLLAGTIDPAAAPGGYPITIERYNTLGETVSQSFVLTVFQAPAGFAAWIEGFDGLADTSATGDPDFDGLENLVEYCLGRHPGTPDAGGAFVIGRDGAKLTFTWRRSKAATGLTAWVECATGLGSGAVWSKDGVSESLLEDNAGDQLHSASVPIEQDVPQRYLRLRVVNDP